MNWIDQLNQSVEYIESNLDKTIDMQAVSRIAGCSPYHYQRMFSLISEITLGEYIRKRRLTLAAYELQNSDASVEEAREKGMIEDIFKLSNGKLWGVMGALANYTQDTVDYYIVAASDEDVPEDMAELNVEESLWVIFPCYGRESIQPVWKRIYGEWFPQSGYEHSGGVEVEWYSDGDLDAEDYLTEIWIPIKEIKKHGTLKSDFDKEKRSELSAGQYFG